MPDAGSASLAGDDAAYDLDIDDVVPLQPASPDANIASDSVFQPGTRRDLIVTEAGDGQRIDYYLTTICDGFSRSQIRAAVQDDGCEVDGRIIRPSFKVRSGQRVRFRVPDQRSDEAIPENIDLDVLYEDDGLVVVNKPAGMVVHPARGNWTGTLTSGLAYRFQSLSDVGGPTRPGIVHRLDRDTSGVIVVAKTNAVHISLAQQFHDRDVGKEYWAITAAPIDRDRDVIDAPIGRHPYQRDKQAIRSDHETSRPASTFYEVLARQGRFCLVKCQPKTGRTHQIRVHLSHIGSPILCDRLYAGHAELTARQLRDGSRRAGQAGDLSPSLSRLADDAVVLERQALHAHRLSFINPQNNQSMTFTAPLAVDMRRILELLSIRIPMLVAALMLALSVSIGVASADQPGGGADRPQTVSRSVYADVAYDQPLRPQFHFLSKRNWINDPNGMVHDGRQYHLYFQHNPSGTQWGNMTWGHATSPDMIHWTQHAHAILPYEVDGQAGTIFSGTGVVDHRNTLGVQVGDTPTIVAFYTFATQPRFFQAMAYSTDGGMTFTLWNEGRAVVPNQGFDREERDPKVFWHEPSQRWVMSLWVQQNPGRIRWFTSKNLKDWEFASDLMRDWAFECMDVVFLNVDDDPDKAKCVIYDASFDYEVGTFDGKTFTSETPPLLNVTGNYYAGQTFNDSPDGRAVQIAWMRGGPDSSARFDVPHHGQMGFPVELKLRTTPAGVRLFCWPIREIDRLVTQTHEFLNVALPPSDDHHDGVAACPVDAVDLVDVDVTFSPGSATRIELVLPRVTLTYDCQTHTLHHIGVDQDGRVQNAVTLADLRPRDGAVRLRLLVDRLSVEAYAFDGESFAAHYIQPDPNQDRFAIRAVGGQAHVDSLIVRKLASAW